jgi:hypothetical protein
LPRNFFSLLIADEAHDYKSAHSAQGQAIGVLADQVKKKGLKTLVLLNRGTDIILSIMTHYLGKYL